MLSNILVLAVLSMLALGSAGKIPDQIMNRPPQIVAVMKPDQTPVLQRSKQALDELVLPPGNSPCGTQISALATMARSCLGNFSTAANGTNTFWCQDRLGCRQTLRAPVRNVALACKPDDKLRSNAIQIMNQILYATRQACPEARDSCDSQASLVNDMLLMNSDQPEFRNLACTSCVKQSFGRMTLSNSSVNHPEVYAKIQCNKINEKFCTLTHDPLPQRICDPCYQRSAAKKASLDRLQGIKSDADFLLQACYDDGRGDSCLSRVIGELMMSNNITKLADAEFRNFRTLASCQKQNACSDKQCQTALQSLIDRVGCCASAIPVALLGGSNLSCLRSMIEKKEPCNKPFSYMVTVTLKSQRKSEELTRLLAEDLATTLATTSDLISCTPHTPSLDRPDQGVRTLQCSVRRYRSIGMPGTINFDPDLLQDSITDVRTSAVL